MPKGLYELPLHPKETCFYQKLPFYCIEIESTKKDEESFWQVQNPLSMPQRFTIFLYLIVAQINDPPNQP